MSLRARDGAPVSMPVSWARLQSIEPAGFTLHDPPELLDEWRDPPAESIRADHLREFGVD